MGLRLVWAAAPSAGQLLEAADRALRAGAFDAARANAALAIVSVIRVLAGRPPNLGVGETGALDADAELDALEDLARDARSVLEAYRTEVFSHTNAEDAQNAVTVARRATVLLGRDE